jgi:hypothetical protein
MIFDCRERTRESCFKTRTLRYGFGGKSNRIYLPSGQLSAYFHLLLLLLLQMKIGIHKIARLSAKWTRKLMNSHHGGCELLKWHFQAETRHRHSASLSNLIAISELFTPNVTSATCSLRDLFACDYLEFDNHQWREWVEPFSLNILIPASVLNFSRTLI